MALFDVACICIILILILLSLFKLYSILSYIFGSLKEQYYKMLQVCIWAEFIFSLVD